MKIERITLREIRMRLRAPFETSFGVTQQRRILLVEAIAEGVSGWGEITAMESPSYNAETADTAWHIVSDFIAPVLIGQDLNSASDLPSLLGPIRGHAMAKAGVENAVWDIEAQQRSLPLWKLLGGTRDEIACGVSLGIRENPDLLVRKVEEEVSAGYQRIKLKIKPGKDLGYVAAVRREFPEILLSVDANSAYTLADTGHLRELDEFNLLMMEQPLGWDDIYSHAQLQERIRTSICLDECINHQRDAETALELGACRIINIKLGRVGGHSGARKVHDVCVQRDVPVWCGGMLESGIGRAHNIAMSTLSGFTLPGDVSASRRYWEEDIIEPEVEVSARGTIASQGAPGLGYAIKTKLIEELTVRSKEWTGRVQIAV
ncbi:MAG TPA: o-succinylbenzoate synthase [Candidatus Acidoferrales bacterium]|nr:o-succinylbenzoate synthase [Candidatus Acidoferrales bacterium]